MSENTVFIIMYLGMFAFFGTLLYEAFSDLTWEDVFPKKVKKKKA
jgi:hypothetical protein